MRLIIRRSHGLAASVPSAATAAQGFAGLTEVSAFGRMAHGFAACGAGLGLQGLASFRASS